MAEMGATEYHSRGVKYAGEGNYDLAILDLTEAIRLERNNAYVYGSRAEVHLNKKDNVRAIIDYTDALRLGLLVDAGDVLGASVYFSRGVAYSRKGSHKKALEDFKKALSLNPNDEDIHKNIKITEDNLSHISESQLRYREANLDCEIEDMKRKIQIEECERTIENYKLKRKQGIEKYTEELCIDPNSASAYYNRGVEYSALSMYNEALEDFERAVNLEPSNNSYREALEKEKAEALEREKTEQEAAEREVAERNASIKKRFRFIIVFATVPLIISTIASVIVGDIEIIGAGIAFAIIGSIYGIGIVPWLDFAKEDLKGFLEYFPLSLVSLLWKPLKLYVLFLCVCPFIGIYQIVKLLRERRKDKQK